MCHLVLLSGLQTYCGDGAPLLWRPLLPGSPGRCCPGSCEMADLEGAGKKRPPGTRPGAPVSSALSFWKGIGCAELAI